MRETCTDRACITAHMMGSHEKQLGAAIHDRMSVDNLHPNIILSMRDTEAPKKKKIEEGCISFGYDGSWQAFFLSMSKRGGRDTRECDIQCTVRV